jgi:hypothetical protein
VHRIANIESAGFRRDADKAHVIPFTGKKTGRRIYLKHKTQKLSVVFHPSSHVSISKLAEEHGLTGAYEYFNNNMTDFPSKKNKGKAEENYGVALDFPTVEEMHKLLARLA